MGNLDAELFGEVAAIVESWKRPLLLSHARPDGDALGSLIAMRSLLRSRGIDATAMLFEPLPDRYDLFRRYDTMPALGRQMRLADLSAFDGVIVLDTCTYNQLDPIADWLKAFAGGKLAVDHHVTRDDLAEHYLIDETAAATCQIIYDWTRAVGWPIESEASEGLFVGMAMDTGWFRHSNTDDRVLSAAADLTARGVAVHELHQQLYQCETPARVRLLGTALGALELLCGDRLAVMALSADAIRRAGATPADTEEIVNEPLRISSVAVSVLLVEADDHLVRISFRSKPPVGRPAISASAQEPQEHAGGLADVDVAAIAQSFGGGGHRRAAGARVAGTLQEVHAKVVSKLEQVLAMNATRPA